MVLRSLYSIQSCIYLAKCTKMSLPCTRYCKWIRIQRYKITDKMKGKAEFYQQQKKFSQEIIFFKCELKKVGADFADGHLLTQLIPFFTFKN